MTQRTVRKMFWTLLTAAAGLGMVGSAQAALVTGRFDPAFGSNFQGALAGTNLYYSGTATFEIADACLSLTGPTSTSTGAFVYAGYDCGGSSTSATDAGMKFLGATVNFNQGSASGAFLGSVTFGASSSAILGMYVQNDVVTGVQSQLIGPAASTLSSSVTSYPDFKLLFGSEAYANGSIDGGEGAPISPGHDESKPDLDDMAASAFQGTTLYQVGSGNKLSASNIATTSFDVPEPGSLALVLGALAAAGTVRRRRNR